MIPSKALPGRDDYHIEAVAKYDITARILGTKRYYVGPANDLIPIDVAVGDKIPSKGAASQRPRCWLPSPSSPFLSVLPFHGC